MYEEVFTKDANSKIRSFYKKFYQLVKKFIDQVDEQHVMVHDQYAKDPKKVISHLKRLHEEMKR